MKRRNVFDLRSLILGITFGWMLTACNDNDIKDPIIDEPADQVAYIAFNESIDDTWVAKYSAAGVETALSDGKKDAHVTSLILSGSDVFASGSVLNSKNQSYALYWKNGVAVLLTDSTSNQYALAQDIAVSDGNVYVAGYMFNGNHAIAMYWKNGVAVELSDGKTPSYARSIFVVGNDVYVAGNVMNKPWGGTSEARYWKNGEEIKLKGSYASSIFVVGSTVYVAGSFGTTPSYFKNGVAVLLNEAGNIGTSDIFADGENVYVASPGMYWKNDTKVNLSGAAVSSLFVLDKDVYIGGFSYNGNKYVAQFWKNGEVTDLTDGTNNAQVSSIFVAAQ